MMRRRGQIAGRVPGLNKGQERRPFTEKELREESDEEDDDTVMKAPDKKRGP